MTETNVPHDELEQQSRTEIGVTVTFPLGKEPFRGGYPPETAVDVVRTAAMQYFEVMEDPALRFYLTHEGREAPGTETLAEVAGHAHAVKFTLVREIVNGSTDA